MAGFSISILMSIIMFMYLFFIAIFVAIILYLIISYTFEGISIMCMGKKLKYKNIFSAWIPFYNKYVLGKISNSKVLGMISCVLSFISVLLGIRFYIQQELLCLLTHQSRMLILGSYFDYSFFQQNISINCRFACCNNEISFLCSFVKCKALRHFNIVVLRLIFV